MKSTCCGTPLHRVEDNRKFFIDRCPSCRKRYTQYKRQAASTPTPTATKVA